LANKIEFNVLVSGVEEISKSTQKISESLKKFSSDIEAVGKSFKTLGRDISQIGSTFALAGASITGPFLLAFNKASKNIGEVNQVLIKFQNTFSLIAEKIATSIVPIMDKMANILNNLFNAFNSLSPAMQNIIIQTTFIAGIFLTLGGSVFFVAGKILTLYGNLTILFSKMVEFVSLNLPLVAVLVLIVAIGAAMWKWKPVADAVLSTFQALFLFLKNGLLTVKIALESVAFAMLQNIQSVVDLMAKIPGPTQTAMQMLSNEVQNLSNIMRGGINEDLKGIITNAETLGQIFTTGTGSWSNGFQDLKKNIDDTYNKIVNLKSGAQQSADQWSTNYSLMTGWVGQLGNALSGLSAQNKQFAIAAQVVAIGMAIMNTAEGVTKAWAQGGWFGGIGAAIVAAAGAIQIATIASQQFAVGSPEIPKDMMAQVHKGETIIPETFADSIRKGDLTLSGQGQHGGGIIMDFTNTVFNGVTQEFVTDIFTKASEAIQNRTLTFRSA
jgi:hypothetical protein